MDAVRVKGSSMAPLALDGQHVLCTDDRPEDGGLAVVELQDGELLFKRVYYEGKGAITLVGVNPDPHEDKPMRLRLGDVRRIRRVWGIKF